MRTPLTGDKSEIRCYRDTTRNTSWILLTVCCGVHKLFAQIATTTTNERSKHEGPIYSRRAKDWKQREEGINHKSDENQLKKKCIIIHSSAQLCRHHRRCIRSRRNVSFAHSTSELKRTLSLPIARRRRRRRKNEKERKNTMKYI